MGGGRPKFNSLPLALAGDKSRERSEEEKDSLFEFRRQGRTPAPPFPNEKDEKKKD